MVLLPTLLVKSKIARARSAFAESHEAKLWGRSFSNSLFPSNRHELERCSILSTLKSPLNDYRSLCRVYPEVGTVNWN